MERDGRNNVLKPELVRIISNPIDFDIVMGELLAAMELTAKPISGGRTVYTLTNHGYSRISNGYPRKEQSTNSTYSNILIIGEGNTVGSYSSSKVDKSQNSNNANTQTPKKTSKKEIFINITKILGAILILSGVVYKFMLEMGWIQK